MSRSGYSEDCDSNEIYVYRGQVASSIRGKRGQAFLRELLTELDAMEVKELIENKLINEQGQCCAIGVVCKARGIDVSKIYEEEPSMVGEAVGISWQLAAEIAYLNDEENWRQTPAERWTYMRKWVADQIWDWVEIDAEEPATV